MLGSFSADASNYVLTLCHGAINDGDIMPFIYVVTYPNMISSYWLTVSCFSRNWQFCHDTHTGNDSVMPRHGVSNDGLSTQVTSKSSKWLLMDSVFCFRWCRLLNHAANAENDSVMQSMTVMSCQSSTYVTHQNQISSYQWDSLSCFPSFKTWPHMKKLGSIMLHRMLCAHVDVSVYDTHIKDTFRLHRLHLPARQIDTLCTKIRQKKTVSSRIRNPFIIIYVM